MKGKSKNQLPVKGQKCLNCGHVLANEENYCPECGQENDQRRMSIRNFLHTMLAGFYSFDSRFFRTIIPLIIRPGKVSKEYIHGRRTYYNNPFQLLLQTAIVFFIVIGLINTFKNFNSLPEENIPKGAGDTLSINFETQKDQFEKVYSEKLDSLFKAGNLKNVFQNKNTPKSEKDSLFGQMHFIGMKFKFPEYTNDNYVVDPEKIDSFNIHFSKTTRVLQDHFSKMNIDYKIDEIYFSDVQKSMTSEVANKIGLSNIGKYVEFARNNDSLTTREALDSLKLEYSKSNVFWYQKAAEFNQLLYEKEYRQAYLDGIVSKTTLALFLLLPLFTLFMTLIYFNSRYNYSENLVVVFNLQTVFFITMLISVLIYNLVDNRLIIVMLNLAYFFYVYKTLRSIYNQGRLLTVLKFILLTMFYGFLSLTGFLLISFLVFLF